MKNYFLSATAEQDIDEIISYIAEGNKTAALKLLDVLYDTLDMLAANPNMGYKKPFLQNQSIRF